MLDVVGPWVLYEFDSKAKDNLSKWSSSVETDQGCCITPLMQLKESPVDAQKYIVCNVGMGGEVLRMML